MKNKSNELKEMLDHYHDRFNRSSFIEKDPVSIPHLFSKKEDIEISGLITATISWGNRAAILKSANKMMQLMDFSPFDFVMNHTKSDLKQLNAFVHRTFNGIDLIFFIQSLQSLYLKYGGLEQSFSMDDSKNADLSLRIHQFRKRFFETRHMSRSEKHVSDPLKNSSAKRICMFLRWMVRKDRRNVDFGIWHTVKANELYLPLDVHTGNIGRKLGLLNRRQNDWKAVMEITGNLKKLDSNDPVKYDYALFGMGIEKII